MIISKSDNELEGLFKTIKIFSDDMEFSLRGKKVLWQPSKQSNLYKKKKKKKKNTGIENDLQTKSRRCISLGINKRQKIHHERKN